MSSRPLYLVAFGTAFTILSFLNQAFGWFRAFDWLQRNSPSLWGFLVNPVTAWTMIVLSLILSGTGLFEIWQWKHKVSSGVLPALKTKHSKWFHWKYVAEPQLPSSKPTSISDPRIVIANGTGVTVPGYTTEAFSFEGVSVANVARAMQTLASCVKTRVTYKPVSGRPGFILENIRQWVVWTSQNPVQFESTNSPSISSLTDQSFTLLLLFRWGAKYYAAFFPPREYDAWWIDYGDWEILVELTDASGNTWKRLLKVELRINSQPRWIDAFTPLVLSGGLSTPPSPESTTHAK